MTVGFPSIGRTIPPPAAERPWPLPAGVAPPGSPPGDRELPAAPPPEVMAEVRAAARSAKELGDRGLELRFERDEHGRICAELRDLRGDAIRRLPLAEVLDVGRGAELG